VYLVSLVYVQSIVPTFIRRLLENIWALQARCEENYIGLITKSRICILRLLRTVTITDKMNGICRMYGDETWFIVEGD
jgi:hypothetical protein